MHVMNAIAKLERLTLKTVHERLLAWKPKLALETVYRWRAALRSGKGITDDKKRLLIQATAGTSEAITWADFQPPEVRPADEDWTPGGRFLETEDAQ
jgi:hypothetical protein